MHTDIVSIDPDPVERLSESPTWHPGAPVATDSARHRRRGHGAHTVMSNPSACTRRALSCRLDREWAQLCRRPAVVERVRSWNLTTAPFGSLPEFLRLCGHGLASGHRADADLLLARLVALADVEPLAARIVLQRILPGLLSIVRREQSRDRTVDAFDLLVGEAWLSIATYRVGSRPTNIAARLLNDARHRAFTTPRRRRDRNPEDVVAPATLDRPGMPAPSSAFDELVAVLTDARRRGLGDPDVAAVRDFLAGDSTTTPGGVTDRTLRNRRTKAVKRIRSLAA